jgi:isopenicillin N synthase-like dioxygenase
MENLHTALERVGHAILRAVIRASRPQDDDVAVSRVWSDGVSTLRAMRYPWPPPSGWESEPHDLVGADTIVAGAHCDNGTGISMMVWQSHDGLQVERPAASGEGSTWLDVPAVDGGLSIHVGKGLEIQTGGLLQATRHRVLATARQPRSSIGLFFCPHPVRSVAAPTRYMTRPAIPST